MGHVFLRLRRLLLSRRQREGEIVIALNLLRSYAMASSRSMLSQMMASATAGWADLLVRSSTFPGSSEGWREWAAGDRPPLSSSAVSVNDLGPLFSRDVLQLFGE